MDVAADFTMGVWVVAVEVATVGVGTAGIEFTDTVGVVGKGWAIALTLYLLFTSALALLFFYAIWGTRVFLVKKLLWEGVLVCGCNWGWAWGLGLGPSLPSNSRHVFVFLIKEGQGQSLVLQGLHNITWVVLSLLNMWIPLIIFTFTSTSTVSNGSRHLYYPCRKLHSGFRIQAIWKISYIVIQSFWYCFNHTVPCVPVAKVNHIIPCLSNNWKSRGSFFIQHLILILSWSLIVTTLDKLTLLPLKVTVTSFWSIFRVSHM